MRLYEGGFSDKGYIDPIEQVVNGTVDFGMSDASSILVAPAAGKPVVAVGTVLQRSPLAVISLDKTGIVCPQDLVGRRVAVADGGLRAFVAAPVQTGLEQADVNRLLKESSEAHTGAAETRPRFRTLFLYTLDGNIVAASDEAQIGRVVTRQPYFEPSKAEDYIQPPYYALGNNELTVVITPRLMDESGNTVGALGAQLDLSALSNIMLEHSGLGESGETYLVSRESNYLLTPSRFPGYSPTQAYHSEGIDKGLQAQEGSGSYSDYRDPPVPVLGSTAGCPSYRRRC